MRPRPHDAVTLQQWLRQGEAQLRLGPHPDRARADAEALLLNAARRDRAGLLAHWNERLDPREAAEYVDLIERRMAGEPIQYITGKAEFYGLSFHLTPAVLIPRPETEHLVEKVIEWAARFPQPRILDVGAGSGAIAIALTCHLPQASITAIDISADALEVARGNAQLNQVADRIRFLQGDLLAPVAGETFDAIVSNPPYVPTADRATLSVEVRDHEPALALFAGEDGLEIYRRLIPAAHAALVPGGLLAMEIGFGQSDAIRSLLADAGFQQIEFAPDLQGIPRVAAARRC